MIVSTPAWADEQASCQEVSVPVAVAGDAHARIAGSLCLPEERVDAIQVLVPGATYNRIYWDFPERSYARYAQDHGQATLAMDRLDTGRSTQVDPQLVTVQADASSIHQVIDALRAGKVGGQRFSRVLLAGHSLGSIVAVDEAATYHDVDALALTGFSHFPRASFLAAVPVILKPTQTDGDPRLANRPVGELTIDGPDRKKSFYAPDDADPKVVATDAATKDTLTANELTSFPTYQLDMNRVTAPTLIAVGNKDAAFGCGPAVVTLADCSNQQVLRTSEQPYFTNARTLDTYVQQGSGHDLNLSNHYRQWFDALSTWAAHHSH